MFICLLDASKAFDRINNGKLFIKLQERGVPAYLIRILHYWYKACKLDGAKQYQPHSLLPMGSDKEEYCHLSFIRMVWLEN